MQKFSLKKSIALLIGSASLVVSSFSFAQSVEEKRLPLASKTIPKVVKIHDQLSQSFATKWQKTTRFANAKTLVDQFGSTLWANAKEQVKKTKSYDDRALYWQRLKLSAIIRDTKPSFALTQGQKQALLQRLETASRGLADLDYTQGTQKKILLTGFDPFLLDKNIDQSNPSGVTALLLDGMVIEKDGIKAEINTFIVPVRYGDFDEGMIEQHLAPFYALNSVDLITTVSMGRKMFDLERFPGKRRSVTAPGNLNVLSGGSKTNPVISKLGKNPLSGDEFVEFSLPVKAMQKAQGAFDIIDNHQVTTLEKTFKPKTLDELKNHVAVEGSGGGYLSNEISYRSIRLKNQLNSTIPTGHIHTPRIKQFEPHTTEKIVTQIVNMLKESLSEI